MPYTEADFERMERDPAFARQYYWRVAMGWLRDPRAFEAQRIAARYILDNLDEIAPLDERAQA